MEPLHLTFKWLSRDGARRGGEALTAHVGGEGKLAESDLKDGREQGTQPCHRGVQLQGAPFTWFSLLWPEGDIHIEYSVWVPPRPPELRDTVILAPAVSFWMGYKAPGPHHPMSFLGPTWVFFTESLVALGD